MSNPVEKKTFRGNIQEIHSADAYYKNVLLQGDNLIIPYINLGISNHPLNDSERLAFLDYAYMVFKGVFYLDVFVSGNRYNVIERNALKEKYHFGGTYLDEQSKIFNDLTVSCEDACLCTLDFTKISDTEWVPIHTRNFEVNLEREFVDLFFQNIYFPKEIL